MLKRLSTFDDVIIFWAGRFLKHELWTLGSGHASSNAHTRQIAILKGNKHDAGLNQVIKRTRVTN